MTPESLPPQEPAPAGLSEFARITGVFFEPKRTFEDIAKRPRWLVPMLLVVLAGIAFGIFFGQRVGWERMQRQQIETNARLQQQMSQLTPEQRENSIRLQAKIMTYGFPVGVLLGTPVAMLISAALVLAVVSMMGGGVKFKQMFSITAYSGLPGVIKWILAIVVMHLKDPDQFNMQNPLAFNPAAFMDPVTTNKFVYTVASSLDVFIFWSLFLTATGLAVAAGKRMSFGKAFVAVLIPYAVMVLIGATIAGLTAG